ncbi:MAG: DUF2784 domain-containing protein [Gammaproteobacteria bacterium]
MKLPICYLMIADVLLLLHVLVVVFIVAGLVVIYVGRALAWSWVRNPWFRSLHVAAMGIVTIQSWIGSICPLTTWEMSLRNQADGTVYAGSFISYWLESLLYFQAPVWLFTVVYTAFGALVIASWFFVRPRSFGNS